VVAVHPEARDLDAVRRTLVRLSELVVASHQELTARYVHHSRGTFAAVALDDLRCRLATGGVNAPGADHGCTDDEPDARERQDAPPARGRGRRDGMCSELRLGLRKLRLPALATIH